MQYAPKYDYIPPLHKSSLTSIYDLSCSLGRLGKSFKRWIIKNTVFNGTETVLDLGCATGVFIVELKKMYPSCKVIGVDPDQDSLKIAEARLAGYTDVKLIHAFAEALPLPDSSVQMVFSTLVFHHLPDEIKRKSIEEIKRVLVPGGKVIIVDFGPNASWAHQKYLNFLENKEYIAGNFKGVISDYLRDFGFRDIKAIPKRFSPVEKISAVK